MFYSTGPRCQYLVTFYGLDAVPFKNTGLHWAVSANVRLAWLKVADSNKH